MAILKSERVGTTFTSKTGYACEVVEYIGANKVKIRFSCGVESYAKWCHLVSGIFKYPKHKTFAGVGFIGEGEYSSVKDPKA